MEEPPTEVLKLSNNFKSLFTAEGLRQAREYEPEDSDIFVVGVQKTGTTLTQHVSNISWLVSLYCMTL